MAISTKKNGKKEMKTAEKKNVAVPGLTLEVLLHK